MLGDARWPWQNHGLEWVGRNTKLSVWLQTIHATPLILSSLKHTMTSFLSTHPRLRCDKRVFQNGLAMRITLCLRVVYGCLLAGLPERRFAFPSFQLVTSCDPPDHPVPRVPTHCSWTWGRNRPEAPQKRTWRKRWMKHSKSSWPWNSNRDIVLSLGVIELL